MEGGLVLGADYGRTRPIANQKPLLIMKPEPKLAAADRGTRFGSLLVLAILAPIAGAASGLVGALFRLTLEGADRFRGVLIASAQQRGLLGLLLVIGRCAAPGAVAAWLVRAFAPSASRPVRPRLH